MKSMTASFLVASIERSVEFYRDVLGFEVTFQTTAPDGKLGHAEVRSGAAAVMFDRLDWAPEAANAPRGNGTNLYFDVGDADIDAYYERVRGRGADVAQEIHDQFWGDRHFVIRDPDGYHLSFAKKIRDVRPEEIEAMLKSFSSSTN